MNKKGLLLGEFTLKIIVAVLSLVILLALLFGIYAIFDKNQKLGQASATLDLIEEGIDVVEGGENYEGIFYSPKDWVIISYETTIGDCLESCLCICEAEKKYWEVTVGSEQYKKCDLGEGVCRKFEGIILPSALKLDQPIDIVIEKKGDKYELRKK